MYTRILNSATAIAIFFTSLTSFAVLASSSSPLPASYDYPEQPGLAHLAKTDPARTRLTDGIKGSAGPAAAWGEWGKKSLTIDWSFATPARLRTIEVAIVHPAPSSDNSHPGRLLVYAVSDEGAPFSQIPDFVSEIPFEEGSLQNISLALPGDGLVAARLRTVFEAKRHQVVLSEINFTGSPASANEIAQAQKKTSPQPAANVPTYDYPPQAGLDHITQTDPRRVLLTDGQTGSAGDRAVWGKWGAKEMIIDWNFPSPVRITSMRATIVHPAPQSDNSHASAIQAYALAGTGDFLPAPDFSRDIPFEAGSLQEVRFVFPDKGLVAERLRTVFAAGRHQVVLSEVTFETVPATRQEADKAQLKRLAAQPEQFAPVTWLPRPLASDARVFGDSIFGICGHFLHTNAFFSNNPVRFNDHWRPSRTLPWVVEGNFTWIRETLYLGLFRTDGANASAGMERRARIEEYLQRYQDRGLKVLLGPMFGGGRTESFENTAEWVGQLARRFSCVRAVELHNEPNLKGFWKGTPQEFVDTARAFTSIVKKNAPETTIVAGSFSGWGGAWQHENLRELLQGDREIAAAYAEEVFKLGLLEFADALSTHPYRGSSAPEGGDVIEARTDPEGFSKEIRSWLDLAAKYTPGGKRLPLYLTEIGYSVSNMGYSNVPTEERQADYITRLMLVLLGVKTEGVPLEAVFWYDLKQDEMPDNHYESNFGIISPNTNRARPAWSAVRRVNVFFAQNTDFIQVTNISHPKFTNGNDLIKSYIWQRTSDGALIVPFWRMNQLMKKDANFDSELLLSLPAGFNVANITLHDLHEDRPRSAGHALDGNMLRIPVHVTSRAAWLVIQ